MFTSSAAQSRLDAILWTALLQTLFTGVYTIIFLQAIGLLTRSGQHKVYATVLVLLYSCVAVHLGANWTILRDIFISHNDTRNTMARVSLNEQLSVNLLANVAAFTAIWLGDVLLLWRCYVLWKYNKIMLAIFTAFMLGEIVTFSLQISMRLGHIIELVTGTLMLLSVGKTILATSLIIYRIHHVSKGCRGLGRYSFTIEVLAESGAIYAVTLLVDCILLITRGTAFHASPTRISFWIGVLTPIAGIAPTLIALRIATGAARTTSSVSQPVSSLRFNRPAPLTTVHSVTFDTT